MKQENYTERDWQLFRSRLPQWQESYMTKLNEEYAALLTADGNASDNFGHWKSDSKKTSGASACVWR